VNIALTAPGNRGALSSRGACRALIDLTAHHQPLAPLDGELERLDCEGFGRQLF
jgi:hypothetical protein